MSKRRFLVAFCALSGCFTQYSTMADVSPAHKVFFDDVEKYYLGKAKEQAAFSLSCPGEQMTAVAVSRRPIWVTTFDEKGHYVQLEHGEHITTIGAEGCGSRATFQVLCGPNQEYGDVKNVSGHAPCDVLAASEAAHAAEKNAADQQQLNEQAARRRQQEEQQRKTH